MALFMITLHNKGVLTGGKNTLITACGLEQGTHATLQAHPIVSYEGLS